MQPALQAFVALLLAHILGDFLFQNRWMVQGKQDYRAPAYATHGLIHLVLAAGALALFTSVPVRQPAALAALGLLTVGHLLLDLGKSALIRWRSRLDGLPVFAVDQLLHVVIVAAAALIAAQSVPAIDWIWEAWRQERDRVLLTALIVTASVFPAGYFIRYLLMPLSRELVAAERTDEPARELNELSNAGMYLGWLERTLLVIAFAAGSFTAVGLIVGAKSVARFPEFRSRAFAEYFLIGTLMSVAIAALGGWILRLALRALAP